MSIILLFNFLLLFGSDNCTVCNLFLPLRINWRIDVWVTDLLPHIVPGGAKSLGSVVMSGPNGVMVLFGVPGGGIVPFS